MKEFLTKVLAVSGAMLAFSGIAHPAPAQGKTWYVSMESKGAENGQSWKNAFHSLQDALSAATKGDEIWVAVGTYTPDASDATKSFALKEDVALYGGFSGSETSREQRDFRKNVSILSGNIGKGDKTKNTRTIVLGADRAILDGFTISDAYGVDKPRMHLVPADILKNDMVVGGGMRNFATSPIVRNCIFKNNYSPKGGAVYNVHKPGADQATFINVEFIDNVASIRGGAVSNDLGAMPRFINCRFIGNKSMDKGGALYNDFAASPFLFNCLFTGNSAVSAGAIGNDGGAAPLLVNVTITDNKASSELGSGLYEGTGANSNPILINSVVDDVYIWHEDVVSEVNSAVSRSQTIPLADFLPISNLKEQLQREDLKSLPTHEVGYRSDLDGASFVKNSLVNKLMQAYVENEGAVKYVDEYTPPAIIRKPVSSSVIYVISESSSQLQDGLSWATAMTDLQAAIELAAVSRASVWIKAGTYFSKENPGKIAAFILYDDVKLYGGFTGTETAVDQRPNAAHPTILSGKMPGSEGHYSHVLYGANGVLLDGLTVRDGNASGFTYNGKGGGLLAYHAGQLFLPRDNGIGFTMTIQNCLFENNAALEGGAIYAFGKAQLTISNTVFKNNQAVFGGAVVDREGVKSTYQNVTFQDNESSQDGGAAYVDYGSHITFSKVNFRGNTAQHQGGAIYELSRASQLEGTVVSVSQCVFIDNKAEAGASIYNLDQSTLTIEQSDYPRESIYNPVSSSKQ